MHGVYAYHRDCKMERELTSFRQGDNVADKALELTPKLHRHMLHLRDTGHVHIKYTGIHWKDRDRALGNWEVKAGTRR